VNVIIAVVALIAAKATELSAQNLAASESIVAFISDRLAMMNLFLAAFNMIPALPMDGGRMLRALLAIRLGYARAAEIAATISQWSAFVLGILGLLYNPRLIIVAIFIFLGARAIKTTPSGW
jgi:Zn-dependent protease